MIPKRIFYVWIGGDEKPARVNICIEDWRKMLPSYEIIEINETSTKYFDLEKELKNNLWFKTVYDLKLYAYVSDYARIKTLYEHGGIYLDTDITVYKDFTPLLDQKMFLGFDIKTIINAAVFGSIPKHGLLGDVLSYYDQSIWHKPDYVITNIITNSIKKLYNNILNSENEIIKHSEFIIYPKVFFYPLHHLAKFSSDCITPDTYTIHWHNQSWLTKLNLYFLTHKHQIPLPTLLKQMTFIEKCDQNAHKKIDMVQVFKQVNDKIKNKM
jgi:mannosyltransferase OCH1-like enzyme